MSEERDLSRAVANLQAAQRDLGAAVDRHRKAVRGLRKVALRIGDKKTLDYADACALANEQGMHLMLQGLLDAWERHCERRRTG